MSERSRYISNAKPPVAAKAKAKAKAKRGQAQTWVLIALQTKGWNASDLADAAQIQTPDLLEWLEGADPAPTYLTEIVQQHLGIALTQMAIVKPVATNPGLKRLIPKKTAQVDSGSNSNNTKNKSNPSRPAPATPKVNQSKAGDGQRLTMPTTPTNSATPTGSPPLKPGQADMLRALLLKGGWTQATFAKEAGKPLEQLSQAEARKWIAYLNAITKGQPHVFKP